ncbi:glycoside hydrolase family 7 protein [Tulasnella calospora MUT 4182]|uniref:Glucanase n=1 Tax=Tulasnella calospora MUT 4182 TaxID=1051891 RepID=A0A0C3Q9F5_9AGAM|nr:glycoside hydrolase family 7 protein [Tulasnella calospora MUT 4182]
MSPALLSTFVSVLLTNFVDAQRFGLEIPEVHPALSWQKCTSSGGCTPQTGKVVLDANWRWYHVNNAATPCLEGIWPDELRLNQGCGLEGIPSYSDLGVTTSGNALRLQFFTSPGSGSPNVGSRVYLLANDNTYAVFKPLAQEIAFDVDVSTLECGIAVDIHFAEMAADGGIVESGGWNTAGAKYGTGYCAAQCET